MIELEATWERIIKVWWAYVWRYLITTIIIMVLGFVFSIILATIFRLLGIPIQIIKFTSIILGVTVSTLSTVIPLVMILNKDFGEFSLVLVQSETEN